MKKKLKWGILATGNIAKAFAGGLPHSQTGQLVAVASRSAASAQAFAEKFDVEQAHCGYEALLSNPEVEAVYIATPHNSHAEWSIKAAEAGKHILCEKPMSMNHAQAMVVMKAVRENDVFFMEAFMYRCHPQTAKLVELIREGRIGEVRMIRAAFGFASSFNPSSRLWDRELGGGGILDVGCYPVSMARLVAGIAEQKPFAEPVELEATGNLHPEAGVDTRSVLVARFASGVLAQLSTAIDVGLENQVVVSGTSGRITVLSPWVPSRQGGTTKLILETYGQPAEEIEVTTEAWLYGIEADTVAKHLEARQAATPAMSWDDSLGNARMLDAWRQAIKLVYPCETAAGIKRTLSGRPLAVRANHPIPKRPLPGLDKPVSRVVMGIDNTFTRPHWVAMCDDFFERGGNTFDMAHIYGGGQAEKLFGEWLKCRGVRDEVVIIDKGAHTPFCTPEHLARQLDESLERLGVDQIDIYFMHRDNPDIPVGEFVDILNRYQREGRLGVFGGSNWTIPRIEDANVYAKANGLNPFVAISNNFSLARMVQPVWDGCVASSEPDFKKWLVRTGMPLFPWSSQARGFFVRADRGDRSDAGLVRNWYRDDNFVRQRRAGELAVQKGVTPLNIALAYVLCQPFPTFPLIGPRCIEETRTSLPALDVTLTPDELAWLNLEDEG